MRIVEIITSAEWGGAQRHVYDLSIDLHDMGHDVVVLYGVQGELCERLTAAGICVEQVPLLTRLLRPWHDFNALSAIRHQIERLGPDVVHVHSSKAGVLVRLALRTNATPVIYTIHGLVYLNSRMPLWKQAFYRAIELSLLSMANATITVSQRDFEELRRRGGDKKTKLVHIPNGIDPFPETIPLTCEPIVGAVVRLTEEKAVDILLKAMSEVRKQIPNVQLILVGDGPLRAELEKMSAELGVDDITLFAGFQENVVEWLGKMRVFVLTSIKEGSPYALLEALAAGRKVLAHDVGTVRELLPSECIVEDQGADTWARALVNALENMGEEPPKNVPTKSSMVSATLRAITDVLSGVDAGTRGRGSK